MNELHIQLATLLPDTPLRDTSEIAPGVWLLRTTDGQRLTLLRYAAAAAARTAAAALRRLGTTLDPALPQLRAADAETAAMVVSELPGEPLAQVVTRVPDAQLYALGQSLGRLARTVHQTGAAGYGDPAEPAGDDGPAYAVGLLTAELEACAAAGLLDRRTIARVQEWFGPLLPLAGRKPALTHGGLSPETVLVRRTEGRWTLSGITGWERASGFTAAWDHAQLLEAFVGQPYFGLRVGYGHAYDELTERGDLQVRDLALAPHRALIALRQIHARRATGDLAGSERARARLLALLGPEPEAE